MQKELEALARFLEREAPIFAHAAAGTAGEAPFACRGYGAVLDAERGVLSVAILRSQILRFRERLAPHGAVAALFTSGTDNESYQAKGRFRRFRLPSTDDAEGIERQAERTAAALPSLVPLVRVQASDCIALEMTVEAVYRQTPGPDAGRRLSEGGG